jgi:hypothetical protein
MKAVIVVVFVALAATAGISFAAANAAKKSTQAATLTRLQTVEAAIDNAK